MKTLLTIDCSDLAIETTCCRFDGKSGVREFHFAFLPLVRSDFATQLERVEQAYARALRALELDATSAVFRRMFCSDITNQAALLAASRCARRDDPECAVSWIGQQPPPAAHVALWAYHICDPEGELDKQRTGNTLLVRRGELSHRWTTGITDSAESAPDAQTRGILNAYCADLLADGLSLADNTIRTWLFVRDIDVNYAGLVGARRALFAEQGLTPQTHFIASTGVEGCGIEDAVKISMDAYAIAGVRAEQVRYLAALDHLSPTHVYGVTFERGVSVAYHDREHLILSGTASIDQQGQILHVGDVQRQLERTLENMDALLRSGGGSLEDLCMMLVYVRDIADFEMAQTRIREQFGALPVVVVHAPVCRPGWLIEIEGIAIIPGANAHLPEF